MTVDLVRALAAQGAREEWALDGFAYKDVEQNIWRDASHRWNVQVFEEKFDLFSMAPALPTPALVISSRSCALPAMAMDHAKVVRTRRPEYTGAEYLREPRAYAGVAAPRFLRSTGVRI